MANKAPRVLIVDDETAVRRVLKSLLEGEGFEVSCCTGAAPALELLGQESFEAILLDNGLPDMMGLAALPAIRERSTAAVILITGFGGEDTVKDALLLGATAVLIKPFELKELVDTIRRSLG